MYLLVSKVAALLLDLTGVELLLVKPLYGKTKTSIFQFRYEPEGGAIWIT